MSDAGSAAAGARLSVAICAHNEQARIGPCLETLSFADEIVVLLDRCADRTGEIAERHGATVIEGAWEIEGARRNAALEACAGPWILEIDADERVPDELAEEIRRIVASSPFDWHELPIDNYVGERLVRYGWGASFGTSAVPRLSRKGVKRWGMERVHPSLTWSGRKGPRLQHALIHHVDRNISDMIRRLDSYTEARARDLRLSGDVGSTANNVRRLFSRFFKCYVSRKGYREGGYGLLIAIFAGLYPLISHLKAKLERDDGR